MSGATTLLCWGCLERLPAEWFTWDQGHNWCSECIRAGTHKRERYLPAVKADDDRRHGHGGRKGKRKGHGEQSASAGGRLVAGEVSWEMLVAQEHGQQRAEEEA